MLASALSRLVPLLLRHLDAYGAVAGEDTKDALAQLMSRLVRVAIAAGCALLAAIMACACILMLTWNEPWREWVPAGLALLFILLALAIGVPAFRRHDAADAYFPRVRREWKRDRKLMERAVGTLQGADIEDSP